MNKLLTWFSKHKYLSHSLAFLLMIIMPIPMMWAAQIASEPWMLLFISLFVASNLIVLLTK